MAEEESNLRVDIVDGEKIFMNPTGEHQDILLKLAMLLYAYQQTSGKGKVRVAAADVFIRHSPLRTRQPDVLFMSNRRIALNPPRTDPAPLNPAPELVVEIISSSETASRFNDKIRDYCTVDVEECWKVMPDTQTVEVLRLSRSGSTSVQTYCTGEIVQSITFSDLRVAVADIFAA